MGIEICGPSGEAVNNRPMFINDGGSRPGVVGGTLSGIKIGTEVVNQASKNSADGKLPLRGKPNSSLTSKNGKLVREYGPDGKAKRDTDYGHPEHHPDLPSPHYHDWTWDGDIPHRGSAYGITGNNIDYVSMALGVGLVICSVGGVILLVSDDASLVGVLDNTLIAPVSQGIQQGIGIVIAAVS